MANNFLLDEDLRSLSIDPKYTGYSSNDVLVETYNGNTFFSVHQMLWYYHPADDRGKSQRCTPLARIYVKINNYCFYTM